MFFFSDLKSNENHFHISLRSLSLPVRWAPCPLTSQWLLRLDFVLKFNHAINGSPGVCAHQVCLFLPCPQPFWCHGGGGGHALLLSPSVWVLLSPPYTSPCREKKNKHQCAGRVKPESDTVGNSMSACSFVSTEIRMLVTFFSPLDLRFLISTLCSHFSPCHQLALMVGRLLWYLKGDKAWAQGGFPPYSERQF